jgi:hypothetical protein
LEMPRPSVDVAEAVETRLASIRRSLAAASATLALDEIARRCVFAPESRNGCSVERRAARPDGVNLLIRVAGGQHGGIFKRAV